MIDVFLARWMTGRWDFSDKHTRAHTHTHTHLQLFPRAADIHSQRMSKTLVVKESMRPIPCAATVVTCQTHVQTCRVILEQIRVRFSMWRMSRQAAPYDGVEALGAVFSIDILERPRGLKF